MKLTFADVPLLLEDPDGKVQEWLDNALPLSGMRLYGPSQALQTHRFMPRSNAHNRVGIGRMNWPDPPKPKINTLWVPTGASRWSVGLFLIDGPGDDSGLDKIIKAVKTPYGGAGGGVATLSIQMTPDDTPLEASMYLLLPRPIDTQRNLWLLPLVDERYFWQFQTPGDLKVDGDTTWDDLFSALNDDIEVSDVDEVYDQPDPTEWTRPRENVGVLLDAAAASIGRRIVYDPFAETPLDLQEYDEAVATYLASDDPNLAGGETAQECWGAIPAQVTVVFPCGEDDVYSSEVEPSEVGGPDVTQPTATELVIFSRKNATGSSDAPDNQTDLDDLAKELATALYGWMYDFYDMTFAGIVQWDLTGLDDYRLYVLGSRLPGQPDAEGMFHSPGNYQCYTRVASLPPNCYIDTQLSAGEEHSSPTAFELKVSLAPGDDVPTENNAWTCPWNPTTNNYGNPDYDSDPDLLVYDGRQYSRYRSLGYDDMPDEEPGATGFCDGNGIIISIEEIAKMLGGSAQVDGSYNLTGVGSLYAMDDGQLPSHGGSAITPLTASSSYFSVYVSGWKTTSGGDVCMLWNEHSGKYRVIDAPPICSNGSTP